eukprot:TRINITY_DN16280_c0_g1_i1.p1 TRINITY_DN16280_c0_g1~~TRINITY_DN16280_c0_g1_i1.p1  ORF type:complete len:1017 (-),score=201.70 TRINITY_DN16280_c0_g1_i1:359-3409(-)
MTSSPQNKTRFRDIAGKSGLLPASTSGTTSASSSRAAQESVSRSVGNPPKKRPVSLTGGPPPAKADAAPPVSKPAKSGWGEVIKSVGIDGRSAGKNPPAVPRSRPGSGKSNRKGEDGSECSDGRAAGDASASVGNKFAAPAQSKHKPKACDVGGVNSDGDDVDVRVGPGGTFTSVRSEVMFQRKLQDIEEEGAEGLTCFRQKITKAQMSEKLRSEELDGARDEIHELREMAKVRARDVSDLKVTLLEMRGELEERSKDFQQRTAEAEADADASRAACTIARRLAEEKENAAARRIEDAAVSMQSLRVCMKAEAVEMLREVEVLDKACNEANQDIQAFKSEVVESTSEVNEKIRAEEEAQIQLAFAETTVASMNDVVNTLRAELSKTSRSCEEATSEKFELTKEHEVVEHYGKQLERELSASRADEQEMALDLAVIRHRCELLEGNLCEERLTAAQEFQCASQFREEFLKALRYGEEVVVEAETAKERGHALAHQLEDSERDIVAVRSHARVVDEELELEERSNARWSAEAYAAEEQGIQLCRDLENVRESGVFLRRHADCLQEELVDSQVYEARIYAQELESKEASGFLHQEISEIRQSETALRSSASRLRQEHACTQQNEVRLSTEQAVALRHVGLLREELDTNQLSVISAEQRVSTFEEELRAAWHRNERLLTEASASQQRGDGLREEFCNFNATIATARIRIDELEEELSLARHRDAMGSVDRAAAQQHEEALQRELEHYQQGATVVRQRADELASELAAARLRETLLQKELREAQRCVDMHLKDKTEVRLAAAAGEKSARELMLEAWQQSEQKLDAELNAAQERENALRIDFDVERKRDVAAAAAEATAAARLQMDEEAVMQRSKVLDCVAKRLLLVSCVAHACGPLRGDPGAQGAHPTPLVPPLTAVEWRRAARRCCDPDERPRQLHLASCGAPRAAVGGFGARAGVTGFSARTSRGKRREPVRLVARAPATGKGAGPERLRPHPRDGRSRQPREPAGAVGRRGAQLREDA